jgi:hypothetical protein
LQTIIQWSLKQQGWRSLLIRMALLTGVWLVVASVFATEFYFSANGMGIGITWLDAARTAFRDWAPWMILSPAVVFLAARFRLHGDVWRRNLLIHLAACGMVSLLYAGLLDLIDPFALTGGIAFTGSADTVGTDGIGGQGTGSSGRGGTASGESAQPSQVAPKSSNGGIAFKASNAGNGLLFFSFANRWTKFLFMGTVKAQLTVPIYGCIACICWLILHLREATRRESRTLELEALLMQSNLQALKMQLQPHFLFNTLNAISSLVHENPRMADDMIGSLSEFLRATLELSSENEIPLSKELDFIDCYLEIQEVRFGDRLHIVREVEEAVLAAFVPALILQPLVENAVRYGIEALEAGGTVTIRAWRDGDTLSLSVSDTGPGFAGNAMSGNGSGIGLSNTRARLRTLYGDAHQFKLMDNPPTGACVTMTIPLRIPASDAAARA